MKHLLTITMSMLLLTAYGAGNDKTVKDNFRFAGKQLRVAFNSIDSARKIALEKGGAAADNVEPRTVNSKGGLVLVRPRDWTSGFFPGTLWYMYEYTGDKYWRQQAEKFTGLLESQQYTTGTHDVGFIMYCSYGNGYRLTADTAYRRILVRSAESLITRFSPVVGGIRSWDYSQWTYPIIIDNMMNLELLFWASEATGDPKYRDIAVKHAELTMKNHYRDDYSSFHVVDYDGKTGQVLRRKTHQGYADHSAWARGQAWGLYGYTVAYRFTKDKRFLEMADKIAYYIFSHPNMPDDLVPYWDFNAPDIPDSPRDVSAAAVAASALYELSTYSEQGDKYVRLADKVVDNISRHYRAPYGAYCGFLTVESTGNKPSKSEIAVPINYADYYFMEANIRRARMKKNR